MADDIRYQNTARFDRKVTALVQTHLDTSSPGFDLLQGGVESTTSAMPKIGSPWWSLNP